MQERILPNVQSSRENASVCVLDNRIYVLGGQNTTAEVLDLNEDDPHWRYIAAMNVDYENAGVAVIGGHIYNIGSENHDCVEKYDPTEGKTGLSLKQ